MMNIFNVSISYQLYGHVNEEGDAGMLATGMASLWRLNQQLSNSTIWSGLFGLHFFFSLDSF